MVKKPNFPLAITIDDASSWFETVTPNRIFGDESGGGCLTSWNAATATPHIVVLNIAGMCDVAALVIFLMKRAFFFQTIDWLVN